jgi:hypothetical protein
MFSLNLPNISLFITSIFYFLFKLILNLYKDILIYNNIKGNNRMANNEGFTTVKRRQNSQPRGKTQRSETGSTQPRTNFYKSGNASSQTTGQSRGNNKFARVVVKSTQTRRKSSRTLLLKEVGDREFKYDGLQKMDKSPQGNVFLVFDNLENSRKAFKDLRVNKVNCKYSYYKLFFKSSNLDTTKNYDELKGSFLSLLNEKVPGINVLYFKYYRRDGTFTGSGDFVVDRKVDCDALVTNRTLTSGENEFTFYRFRTNRGLSNSEQTSTTQSGEQTTGTQGSGTQEGNNSDEEVVNE